MAYIEDGLVFELDGLDKCSTDQYCWVDKIGGKTFTNAGGVEELNNGFRFKRTSTSYLSCNTTLTSTTYDQCTIEIVLKSDLASGDWAPVVMFGDWGITPSSSYIGVAALYSSHVNYAHSLEFVSRSRDGSTKSYKLPTGTLMSTSIKSNLPIIANGESYNETSSTSRACISNRPVACVGGRVDGSNVVTFKGDIHAIRVYNRLLTEDEILHNQNIDIQKYNIPI